MSNDDSDDIMLKYFGVDKEYLEACAIDLIDEGIDIKFDEDVLWSSYEYLENLSKLPYQRDAIPCLKFKMSLSDTEIDYDGAIIRKKLWKFFTRLNKNGLTDIGGGYDDLHNRYSESIKMKDGNVFFEIHKEDIFGSLVDEGYLVFLIVGKEEHFTWEEFLEFYGINQQMVVKFENKDIQHYEILEDELYITTKPDLYYHFLNLIDPKYTQYEPLIEVNDMKLSVANKRLIDQIISSEESYFKKVDIGFLKERLPDLFEKISILFDELFKKTIVDSLTVKLKKIIEKLLETKVYLFTSGNEQLMKVGIKKEHLGKCFEGKVLQSQSKLSPSKKKFDVIESLLICSFYNKSHPVPAFYPEIDWRTLKRTFNENLTSILKNYMSK